MRNLFGLVFILCFVAIVPAQERVIDQSEFDSVLTGGMKHAVIWKGEKYRMTVTTSSKTVGRPQTDWSSKLIFEWESTDKFRTITSSTFGDTSKPAIETARIGSSIYSRSGNGTWTRKEHVPAESGKPKHESPSEVLGSKTQYKYLGTGALMGKPVQIYAKTEQQTNVYKQTGELTETDMKVTYWVDSNGTVIKIERQSEGRSARITTHVLITTLWELDPSISFVPPEVNS